MEVLVCHNETGVLGVFESQEIAEKSWVFSYNRVISSGSIKFVQIHPYKAEVYLVSGGESKLVGYISRVSVMDSVQHL